MAIQLRLAKLHSNKLHAQDWNNVLWKVDIKVKMLNHCVAVGQLTLTRLGQTLRELCINECLLNSMN